MTKKKRPIVITSYWKRQYLVDGKLLDEQDPNHKALTDFMEARALAKAMYCSWSIDDKQCENAYRAAATAFKLRTGFDPPYGPGATDKWQLPKREPLGKIR